METTPVHLTRGTSDNRLAEALITALDVFDIGPKEYWRIVSDAQLDNPFSRIQSYYQITRLHKDVATHYKILLGLAVL